MYILLTIGQVTIISNQHWFLLNIILGEESRLPSHHLLDGSGDDHAVNVVIGPAWLPLLGRNHLERRWESTCQDLTTKRHKDYSNIIIFVIETAARIILASLLVYFGGSSFTIIIILC